MSAKSIHELEQERDDYRTRALHWRTECDKRDKEIHRLREFISSIASRLREELDRAPGAHND